MLDPINVFCCLTLVSCYLDFTCCDVVDIPAAFADMVNLEILNFFNNNIEV